MALNKLLRMACMALRAWGSPSFSSFTSCRHSSVSPGVLSFFPCLIVVTLWFSAKSLHMQFPLPEHSSALPDPVGYLLKIHSLHFAYRRILEILDLRDCRPKTWSRCGHVTQFWLIICTRKSLWNIWKDFRYLIIGRYTSKISQPLALLAFFPRN